VSPLHKSSLELLLLLLLGSEELELLIVLLELDPELPDEKELLEDDRGAELELELKLDMNSDRKSDSRRSEPA